MRCDDDTASDGFNVRQVRFDPDEAPEHSAKRLAAFDREHPIPPPLPACRQVWVFPKAPRHSSGAYRAATIDWIGWRVGWGDDGPDSWGAVYGRCLRDPSPGNENVVRLDGRPTIDTVEPWPPGVGAVLVAGPGSPWMEMRGGDE